MAHERWCRVRLRGTRGELLDDLVICGEGTAGLDAVDRLSRLRMAAERQGGTLELYDVSERLVELLDLAGLLELLG